MTNATTTATEAGSPDEEHAHRALLFCIRNGKMRVSEVSDGGDVRKPWYEITLLALGLAVIGLLVWGVAELRGLRSDVNKKAEIVRLLKGADGG